MAEQASVPISGSWRKRLLLTLGEGAAFTVRVFLISVQGTVLKFSLVQHLLHIREGISSDRWAVEAVLLTPVPCHTTISSHFLLFSISLETCDPGELPYSFVLILFLCAVGTGVEISEKTAYFIPSCLSCLSYF